MKPKQVVLDTRLGILIAAAGVLVTAGGCGDAESPTESERDQLPPFQVSVTEDPGVRAEGALPFALRLDDGRVRLYHHGRPAVGEPGAILSAVSVDGLTFSAEGLRLSAGGSLEGNIGAPSVARTPDGRYRLYYHGAPPGSGPDPGTHMAFSALSDDGLSFAKEGLIFDSSVRTSVPHAIALPDGRVRLYFVDSDPSRRGADDHFTISTAISSDGRNFALEARTVVPKGFVDPGLTRLRDGSYLMVAKLNPGLSVVERLKSLPRGIYAFHALDGLEFSQEVSLLPGGDMDPHLIEIGEETYRVYYGQDPALTTTSNTIKSFTFTLSR